MMNEQLMDTLTASIAKEHGVVLNTDDPILMLHTINAHMLEGNKKAQHAQLEAFRQEMEIVVARWHAESKETAERILNASLQAAKTAMMDGMNNFTVQHTAQIQKVTEDVMASAVLQVQRAEHWVKWNLAAAVITFLSASILTIGFLFH